MKKRSRFSLPWRNRSAEEDLSKGRVPSLKKLLKAGAFDTITNILQDDSLDLRKKWFDKEFSMLGENCLHLLMRFRPSAELVSLMLLRLAQAGIKEPELSVDVVGRTPLHHAVGFLCEESVLNVLLESDAGQKSVRAQDLEGRVPLHTAMRPFYVFGKHDHRKKHPEGTEYIDALLDGKPANLKLTAEEVGELMKDSVFLLLDTWPQSVLVRDDDMRRAAYYMKKTVQHDCFREAGEVIRQRLEKAEEVAKERLAAIQAMKDIEGKVVSFVSVTDESLETRCDISLLSCFEGSEHSQT